MVAVALALLAAGGIGYSVFAGSGPDDPATVPVSSGSGGGCSAIERPELQEATHIEAGAAHDPYSSDPPSSGPHYATPADFGFYATPVPAEQLVHNLEHGQIVIWYRPDLTEGELGELASITTAGPQAIVSVPYAAIGAPDVLVLTAWGVLQRCQGISVEDINEFRAVFQGRGPENVGVPVFEGSN